MANLAGLNDRFVIPTVMSPATSAEGCAASGAPPRFNDYGSNCGNSGVTD